MPAARKAGINVLPVDSEHSALFQCLLGQRRSDVRRVIITASGGPFRDWPLDRIHSATLEEALNHPTWQMGKKITIDSATLMNKALEIIEAHWLFDLPAEKIDVLIHPESIVHGLVEFDDGSVLAQMGSPSMITPIGFALYYPQRAAQAWNRLDLAKIGELHFAAIDPKRHPAILLGYEVIRRGGTAGAVLNGANEAAVAAFLDGRIAFGQIIPIVRDVLNQALITSEIDKDVLLAADVLARRRTNELVDQLQQSAPSRGVRGRA
jgi:1-deoxy-D-xylulose-5-phosphate reductoisomerase